MATIAEQVRDLIFSRFVHTPTFGQQEACKKIVSFLYDTNPSSAFVLKGYAGTGKTTLVSALIQILPQLRLRTVLLAPTGRAAKVLSNYSGKKAYTIHKKIYYTATDEYGIMHIARAKNKHKYTLFIVDEASMIGETLTTFGGNVKNLLEDLVDYVADGEHCRMLLIGDSAQLPPIGSTISPALDVENLESITNLNIYDYEMQDVVRQQEQSGILFNSTLLRNYISEKKDIESSLFRLENFTDIIRVGGADLEECLNREYSENELGDVVVVCRTNKRANIFNREIRNRILYREGELNTGDFLMVVKNNYYWVDSDSEMGFIANGDIVEVMQVRKYKELYGFRFVDVTLRFVDYPDMENLDCTILLDTLASEASALSDADSRRLFEEVMLDYTDIPKKSERLAMLKTNPYYNALQVKFAYSLTCHKTQGGQWTTVFVDQGFLPDNVMDTDYLRWLYTALTRATKKVYLLNFNDSFFE
ncbi:MAG: AAA family ATPase [Bacteroidales bacterium]|nr:AAA family ATPase [Bacteroidales bacterium]